MGTLGLLAGGGALPVLLARHCRKIGQPIFVLRLAGAPQPELVEFDGSEARLDQVGASVEALRRAGCAEICLAGTVARPDFTRLEPDALALRLLPGALAAAFKGDDALLSFMLRAFEEEGFRAVGADEVMAELLLRPGALGDHHPSSRDEADMARAFEAARAIGALDIGQGAVACGGIVLALEAQEGTDAMLRRTAALPTAIRGSPRRRRGVLVKACKPGQDRRVDLPTIGPATIRLAGRAGLAGVAGEPGGLLVLDMDDVRGLADRLGLFVVGID
ncbi:MAG: LpxI family protein [Caulobacteraceae bacterium]